MYKIDTTKLGPIRFSLDTRRTKARIVREALRSLALSPDYPLADCEAAMQLSGAGDDILVRLMGMLK